MALEKEVLESDEFKAAVADAIKAEHAGLLANRDDALADKAKARQLLAAFGDITPEQAKDLAAKAKKAEEDAARKAGDFDALKDKLTKEHASQVEQVAGERDELKTALEGLLIDKAAYEGAVDAKAKPRGLRPHLVEHLAVQKGPDGKYRTVVLDDKGQPRLKKGATGSGDLMSVAEFAATLKDDEELQYLFDGSGASGGATPHRVVHGDKKTTGGREKGYTII